VRGGLGQGAAHVTSAMGISPSDRQPCAAARRKKGPERLAPARLSLRSQEERREAGPEEERRSSDPAKLVDQL